MALVNAKNKRTGKEQLVPAHYIDNPRIHNGAFTAPDADKKPAPAQAPAKQKEQ